MRTLRKILPAALAILAGAFVATPAGSTTQSVNMSVGVTITAACSLSVTNINFGSVPSSSLLSAQTSTSAMGGLLTYICSPGSNAPSLSYGQGLNYSSGNRMIGTTNGGFIPYSLTMPTISTFTGAAQTAQITATIPAQSTLPSVDIYSDTVVLTMTF